MFSIKLIDGIKIDFIRYCIINKQGGVYIDLDIYPRHITFHSFDKYIQQNEYLIGVWFDEKNNMRTNDNFLIMGFILVYNFFNISEKNRNSCDCDVCKFSWRLC